MSWKKRIEIFVEILYYESSSRFPGFFVDADKPSESWGVDIPALIEIDDDVLAPS